MVPCGPCPVVGLIVINSGLKGEMGDHRPSHNVGWQRAPGVVEVADVGGP